MLEHQVEKSLQTLREMLKDRGEDASSLDTVSNKDLQDLIANASGVFHLDVESCKYRIIYSLNATFKLPDIRKLLSVLDPEVGGFREVVIVTREKATSTSKKGVDDNIKKHVQFFNLKELQFNISRHALVPKHIPIRDDAEIDKLVSLYRVKSRYHFPIIACSDPMARYLALRPGQLVRIVRFSPCVGTYSSYRCCAVANMHTTGVTTQTTNDSMYT